ncbi:hypothetical protein M408DRAFT_329758 [Serendipita vermifera MAFF 305830]|uniref:Uncharacterized protein n=1 Tax=Serendipita vermifera MAFF 305830 TaxID=933852 RepID=A0A0C3B6N7_SERVB|nr:hypothetical protein M408DRAFT_329758 [Serendipita vermifera MAFF 305830]
MERKCVTEQMDRKTRNVDWRHFRRPIFLDKTKSVEPNKLVVVRWAPTSLYGGHQESLMF